MRLASALEFLAPGFWGSGVLAALLFPLLAGQALEGEWWWWAMLAAAGLLGLPWNIAAFMLIGGLIYVLGSLAELWLLPSGQSLWALFMDVSEWGLWVVFVCLLVGVHMNVSLLFRIFRASSDNARSDA